MYDPVRGYLGATWDVCGDGGAERLQRAARAPPERRPNEDVCQRQALRVWSLEEEEARAARKQTRGPPFSQAATAEKRTQNTSLEPQGDPKSDHSSSPCQPPTPAVPSLPFAVDKPHKNSLQQLANYIYYAKKKKKKNK